MLQIEGAKGEGEQISLMRFSLSILVERKNSFFLLLVRPVN